MALIKIYCDGSGWNGKLCRIAIVSEKGKEIIEPTFNKRTNNEMEYKAVIRALEEAQPHDEIYTDSALVVNQILGKYKVRSLHLLPLRDHARSLSSKKHIPIKWIPREENKAGILIEQIQKGVYHEGGKQEQSI